MFILFGPTLKLVDHGSLQSFKREVLLWKQLEHENILPLFGITLIDGVPCTVSEWRENGTMDTYLAAHMTVDILELVRTSLYPPCRFMLNRDVGKGNRLRTGVSSWAWNRTLRSEGCPYHTLL